MTGWNVGVVVPAHNEAERIGAVVEAATRRLPVVVVDDGSTDDTADRARSAGASVVVQDRNQGKGAALRAGFRWALDHGCDAAITLDGDGQHDPDDIPAFLDEWTRSGADLVIGRRTFRDMPPVRRLANALGGVLFSRAVGRQIPDNQSGYRLVSSRAMAALLDNREYGFEFEVDMIALAIREGWPIAWLPIRTIYAGERSHITPGRHLRNFLRAVVRARRTVRGRD